MICVKRNFIFSSPQNEGKKIKRQGSYPKKKRTKCKNCKNKKKKISGCGSGKNGRGKI